MGPRGPHSPAYVLAVKGNQKTLFEDSQLLLDDPDATPDDVAQTVDGDHGRIETRLATLLHDVARLAQRHGFPGLQAVGKVAATRFLDAVRANRDEGSARGKLERATRDDAFLLQLLAAG